MITVYKLTEENHETYNQTKWGPGVTHTASGEGALCGPGWLHAYTSPRLAVLFNLIHAAFPNPVLWEAEADEIGINDHGIKIGVRRLTTIQIIPAPIYTTTQRIAFGILCAREVCNDPKFLDWSAKWLSGEDRSANAAACAAAYAADRVAYSAAYSAAYAAYAAACVADAACFARAVKPIDLDALAIRALEIT